jgi:N-dimethylarginine dimethylaminohydrolase
LSDQLRELGYRALGLPMGEFMKAGGGVRCLSLPVPATRTRPVST